MVRGDDGPAVGKTTDARPAGVDHRLDSEHHPRLQLESRTRASVMQHLRLLVKLAADAVAAEFAHDGETMALGVVLDRRADVAEMRSRLDGANAVPHRLVRDFAQPPGLDRRCPHVEHAAGVAVETVLDDCDVDVDDIAGLELLIARDAVTNNVVDRRADRRRIRLIPWGRVIERCRDRMLHVDHVLVTQAVDLTGRHPRGHVRRDVVENFGREGARHAHLGDVVGGFQGYGHGLSFSAGR